jgi:hypothetical protein
MLHGTLTLQEVQVANLSFPLSLLNDHTNFTRQIPESLDTNYPQLESVSVGMGITDSYRVPFASWAKQHIPKLRSLALNNLDLRL